MGILPPFFCSVLRISSEKPGGEEGNAAAPPTKQANWPGWEEEGESQEKVGPASAIAWSRVLAICTHYFSQHNKYRETEVLLLRANGCLVMHHVSFHRPKTAPALTQHRESASFIDYIRTYYTLKVERKERVQLASARNRVTPFFFSLIALPTCCRCYTVFPAPCYKSKNAKLQKCYGKKDRMPF